MARVKAKEEAAADMGKVVDTGKTTTVRLEALPQAEATADSKEVTIMLEASEDLSRDPHQELSLSTFPMELDAAYMRIRL